MRRIALIVVICLLPTMSMASWNAYIVGARTKYRPNDTSPTTTSLTVNAVKGQWACFQVACVVSGEDVAGADVVVSTPTKGADTLTTQTIFKEILYDVQLKSRDDGVIGEWPDALVPKTDLFYGETRNAFPFVVNRLSPVYQVFDFDDSYTNPVRRVNGATTKPTIGGTYSGSTALNYHIKIDGAGAKGVATFKWSDDGGATWDATGVLTGDAIVLNNGLTATFSVQTYSLNDEWEFFVNTSRTEMVWVDVYVPTTAVTGTYTGTVTVSATSKSDVVLNYSIVVYNIAIPKTSSIPVQYIGDRLNVATGHYQTDQSDSYSELYQKYVESGLRHRISTLFRFAPSLSWNGTDISNWPAHATWARPYMNGTWTDGIGISQYWIRAPNELTFDPWVTANGVVLDTYGSGLGSGEKAFLAKYAGYLTDETWWSKTVLLITEEPSPTANEITAVKACVTDARAVAGGSNFKFLATKRYVSDWVGYIDEWDANSVSFGDYPRSTYDAEIAAGRNLTSAITCMTKSCGSIGDSSYNKYPSVDIDQTLPNYIGYWWLMYDNDVRGDLYYNTTEGNKNYAPAINILYRHDPWESIRIYAGNGEGTFWYPGRVSGASLTPAGYSIGGTTKDIPIESLRLKAIRIGLEDYEIFKLAGASARSQIESVTAIGTNKYYYTTPVNYDTMATQMETARTNVLNGIIGITSLIGGKITGGTLK